MVPLIRSWSRAGTEVVLASDGDAASFWSTEFPLLPMVELPPWNIRYAPGPFLVFGILARLPSLRRIWRHEAVIAARLAAEGFDTFVSDGRPGFCAPGRQSVFVSHQLRMRAPRGLGCLEGLGEIAMGRILHGFDEIWVPDHATPPGLSGTLGHPKMPRRFAPLRYMGSLSRLPSIDPDSAWKGPWNTVAVVSGPEPVRGRWEAELTLRLRQEPGLNLLVAGRPGDGQDPSVHGALTVIPHLTAPGLRAALEGARRIVCRGGYTTLMDLESLGLLDTRVILVPTPGQTEQIALANDLNRSRGITVTRMGKPLPLD